MISNLAHGIWAVLALASPIIALLLIFHIIIFGAAALFGARVKRRRRLKGVGRFVAAVIFGTAGIWFLAYYVWLCEIRRTAHACESQVSDNGEYLATQCLLNAEHSYLRVYASQSKRLLADRTYRCEPSNAKLFIDDKWAFDACAEDDSEIDFPPSLLDRLRAKLP